MPSIMRGKRSRLVTVAIAGTLLAVTAASAAAATLPSGSASAPSATATATAHLAIVRVQDPAPPSQGDAMSAPQRLVAFDHVRFSLGERQYQYDTAQAAAKAAAANAKAAASAGVADATTTRQVTGRPSGSPEQIAQQMLTTFGWSSSQFTCLYPLWYHESDWNPSAENPSSGAYGIPQSLPGSQMASAGADWQTNPATQIKWGLTYIQGRYGSPCGAWAHEQADNWY